MSFRDYLGIHDSLLPGLAAGFGGGVGAKGSLCGALTGSVMAIGMKSGRTNPKDRGAALQVYEKCRQFWDRFEKEFGSPNCYDLTGHHLDNPEENRRWMASGGREKCRDIVKRTAHMLCEFIERS